MKDTGFELERKAREALRSCLSRVPFLRIKDFKRQTSKKAVKPDLLVSLAFPKGHKVLVGEIKANGQPTRCPGGRESNFALSRSFS